MVSHGPNRVQWGLGYGGWVLKHFLFFVLAFFNTQERTFTSSEYVSFCALPLEVVHKNNA